MKRLVREAGTHRVSRIPANEKRGRRHTSAVTVSVLPVPERLDTALDMREVDIQFFRASGKGGQHRNKVETAVRAVHKPTGLRAVIADDRSQSANKERALALLAARVAARQSQETQQKRDAIRAAHHGSGHISERFRSYLWREGIVVDHQGGKQIALKSFLEGNFDGLY